MTHFDFIEAILRSPASRPPPPTDDADAVALNDYGERAVLVGLRVGIGITLGRELGDAVFADLTGVADRPNTSLAPNTSRAVVSKWACRCRKNLGLGLRVPGNARPSRKGRAA